jgi:hypothetical protein
MELVTVGSYPTSTEAMLAKNLLETEGVPAFIEEDMTGDLFHLAAPFGEAKLAVASEHAEQARTILASAQRHQLARESAQDAEAHAKDQREDT